jgi:hypothetical protein
MNGRALLRTRQVVAPYLHRHTSERQRFSVDCTRARASTNGQYRD